MKKLILFFIFLSNIYTTYSMNLDNDYSDSKEESEPEQIESVLIKNLLERAKYAIKSGRIPYMAQCAGLSAEETEELYNRTCREMERFVSSSALYTPSTKGIRDYLHSIIDNHIDEKKYCEYVHKSILEKILSEDNTNIAKQQATEDLIRFAKYPDEDIVRALLKYTHKINDHEPYMSALVKRISYSESLKNKGPKILKQIFLYLNIDTEKEKDPVLNPILCFMATCINNGIPTVSATHNLIDIVIDAHKRIKRDFSKRAEIYRKDISNTDVYDVFKHLDTTFDSIKTTIHTQLVEEQKKYKKTYQDIAVHITTSSLIPLIMCDYAGLYDRQPEIDYFLQCTTTKKPSLCEQITGKCLIS